MTTEAHGDTVVQSNIKRRANRPRSRRIYEPLRFWRDGLSSKRGGRYPMVVKELGRIALFGEPQWEAAARGDAASAIGLAVNHLLLAAQPPTESRIDILMTALWRAAVDRNLAAVALFEVLYPRFKNKSSRISPDPPTKSKN